MKTFWMLHKNIDRISAERDMRLALITIRAQSSEGVSEMMKDLRGQMGSTITIDQQQQDRKELKEKLRRLAAIGDLTNNAYPR